MTKLRNGSQVTTRPTRKATAGTAGYFSESNDSSEPSYPGQDWFNDVIDEIVQAVTAADVTYDPTKITNLKSTVEALRNASNLNAGTVPLDRATDPLFISDANTLTKTFFYLTGSTWVGSPLAGDDGNNQGYLIHINWAEAYAAQFFFNINGTWQKKTRRKDAGVWGAWTTDYNSKNLAYAPEITELRSYVGGGAIAAGSATFTNADNNVNLVGVGVNVEVGDVVEFAESALNTEKYTVEVITDADNIIVNQAHAGKGSSHALSDETVGVTATLLCKYYLAPPGLGQGWVEMSVPAERDPASIFVNPTNRLIELSIYMLAGAGNAEVEVGTNRPSVSSNNSTETLQTIVPKDTTYRILGTITVYRWSEFR